MSLILRRAAADDSRDLWLWRNDEQTRRCSRATDPIAWPRHDAWYREKLEDYGSRLLVALDAGVRIGMIRFDRIDKDRFRANIAVAAAARGRGLGHAILRLGCDRLIQEYRMRQLSRRFELKTSPRNAFLKQAGSIGTCTNSNRDCTCL